MELTAEQTPKHSDIVGELIAKSLSLNNIVAFIKSDTFKNLNIPKTIRFNLKDPVDIATLDLIGESSKINWSECYKKYLENFKVEKNSEKFYYNVEIMPKKQKFFENKVVDFSDYDKAAIVLVALMCFLYNQDLVTDVHLDKNRMSECINLGTLYDEVYSIIGLEDTIDINNIVSINYALSCLHIDIEQFTEELHISTVFSYLYAVFPEIFEDVKPNRPLLRFHRNMERYNNETQFVIDRNIANIKKERIVKLPLLASQKYMKAVRLEGRYL